jgi:hypothetical protein
VEGGEGNGKVREMRVVRAVAAVQIWELGRVIWYQRHTKIMADSANVQNRF